MHSPTGTWRYLVDGLADTLNEQVFSLCAGSQQVSHRQQQLQILVLVQFLHGQALHIVYVSTQYEGYTDLNEHLPSITLPVLTQQMVTELVPGLAEVLDDKCLVSFDRQVQVLYLREEACCFMVNMSHTTTHLHHALECYQEVR